MTDAEKEIITQRESAFSRGYKKGRTDAIEEFIDGFLDTVEEMTVEHKLIARTKNRWAYLMKKYAEQIKEQKNEVD